MKQISFAIIIALSTIQYSCKKEPKKDETSTPSDGHIIDQNTGWQYVTAIKYEKPAGDAQESNNNSLSVYDLTNINDEFAVLYSAKYFQKSTSSNMAQFYKVRFKNNDANFSSTKMQAYNANKELPFWQTQFIPNSLIPVFTRPQNGGYEMSFFDENNTKQSHLLLDHFTTKILSYYTPDANFVVSGNDNGKLHFWSARYPSSGLMTDFISLGATENSIVIPMKFSDGSANLFIIAKAKDSKNFEVVKLDDGKETSLDGGGLDGVGKLQAMNQSLMAFDYKDDVLTFVLADYVPTSSSDAINKIHCFRWNQRTKGITKLWECNTTPDFSKAVLSPAPGGPLSYAENIYLNRRIAPDGTFYTIYTKPKYAEPNVGKEYTAIYTANGTGVKQLGKVDELYEQTVAFTHCRYINGAYYALAYPVTDSKIKADDPKFHIELVKYVP